MKNQPKRPMVLVTMLVPTDKFDGELARGAAIPSVDGALHIAEYLDDTDDETLAAAMRAARYALRNGLDHPAGAAGP